MMKQAKQKQAIAILLGPLSMAVAILTFERVLGYQSSVVIGTVIL